MKEGLGVEEALGLEKFVHLIDRQEPTTILSKEIDVEAIKLMVRSITDTSLD